MIVAQEGLEDLFPRQGGSQPDRSPGERLAKAQDIRADARPAQANGWPVLKKPVAISSAMKRMCYFLASAAMAARISGRWNRMPPAPCTSGSMIRPAARSGDSGRNDSRSASESRRWERRRRIGRRVRHGTPCASIVQGQRRPSAGRVTVIAVGKADEPVFADHSAVAPILQCDLECHFHRGRAGIRKKDATQPRGTSRRVVRPTAAPAREPGRRTSHAASPRAAWPCIPEYVDGYIHGTRSTMRRCRQSTRARQPERSGNPGSRPPAEAAVRPASGSREARHGEGRVRTIGQA